MVVRWEEGQTMARCEECDREYEGDLRHCPYCSIARLEAEARRDVRVLRSLIVATTLLVVAFLLGVGLLACTNKQPTSQTTSPSAGAVTKPEPKTDGDRWMPVDGEVILTLTMPESEMVGSAKSAHGMARTVLAAIPTASSVAVFDGNSSLIGRYRR